MLGSEVKTLSIIQGFPTFYTITASYRCLQNEQPWLGLVLVGKKMHLNILEICVVYNIVKTQQRQIILRYKRGIRKCSGTGVNAETRGPPSSWSTCVSLGWQLMPLSRAQPGFFSGELESGGPARRHCSSIPTSQTWFWGIRLELPRLGKRKAVDVHRWTWRRQV